MKLLKYLSLVVFLNIFGVDYDTYNGKKIRFDPTLTQLRDKPPAEVVHAVHGWCAQNPRLVRHFSGHEAFRPSEAYSVPPVTAESREVRVAYWESVKKEFDIVEGSAVNYVVRIAPGLIMKAAGYLNMQQIINATVGNPYGTRLTVEDLRRFKEEFGGRTYQTATRYAGHLRAEQAHELLDLPDIGKSERYLVHLPAITFNADQTYDPRDGNCVVVEREIKGILQPLDETEKALDKNIIKQIVHFGAQLPQWSANGANLVVGEDGKIYALDTEFPNNLPTTNGYITREKFESLVQHGWNELEKNVIEPAAERFGVDSADLLVYKRKIQQEIVESWLKYRK